MKAPHRTRRLFPLVLLLLAPAANLHGQAEAAALRRAREILRTSPVLDTHNDLPWVIREKAGRDVEGFDISKRARYDTDIPRLRQGMIGTQFWSVYVPSGLRPFDAMRSQLEQIDIARRIIAKYPKDLGYAGSVADIQREQSAGRIASLLGMEGGHGIGNSLGALRAYYDLGVRYMTLTHFNGHDWADAATDSARHGGLSRFGEEVVREMNRLGMLVDISHVSPGTMSDALNVTEAPVIFSHSSARALTDHVRNVPDSILRRLPKNGGVVMVAFVPQFISEPVRKWNAELFPRIAQSTSDSQWQRLTREYMAQKGPPPRATIKDLADHVEHIVKVAGIDHVGLGADFYGAEAEHDMVLGLEDVSKYPALFAELIRRGWSEGDLRKLARENLLRAFRQAEVVSERLRRERPPSNATIEELDRRGRAAGGR
jgi:membrane dipeptidase